MDETSPDLSRGRWVTVRPGTTLGQLLKLAAAVATGGEAKARIDAGEVRVNGQVERRRGRKLQPDDIVELAGTTFLIQVMPHAHQPRSPDQPS